MLLITIGLAVAFFMSPDEQTGQWPLLIATVLTGILRRPLHYGYRRSRHACGRLDAQQLLGLGRERRRFHAFERPAYHYGSVGRVIGCHP
jgi:hypothetical protein